jgi:hypothetical protein
MNKQKKINAWYKPIETILRSQDSEEKIALNLDPIELPVMRNNLINNSFTNDLGLLKRPFSNELVEYLLKKGAHQPKSVDLINNKFPVSCFYGVNRRFQENWYVGRRWLSYSTSLNSMFCHFCAIFCGEKVREWSVDGVNSWCRGIDAIRRHEKTENHLTSIEKSSSYFDKNLNIDVQIDSSILLATRLRTEKIIKNREILKHIIEVVLYLAKNNIALRGDCFDDLLLHQSKYDEVLKNHFQNSNKKAIYTHHEIINEFLVIISKIVLNKIGKMVKESEFYGIICDEA